MAIGEEHVQFETVEIFFKAIWPFRMLPAILYLVSLCTVEYMLNKSTYSRTSRSIHSFVACILQLQRISFLKTPYATADRLLLNNQISDEMLLPLLKNMFEIPLYSGMK